MTSLPEQPLGTEVSCVTLGALFHYIDHLGRSPAPMLEGSPYPEEHLRNPHARIDYRVFRRITERFRLLFPNDPQVYFRAGSKIFELESYGFQNILFSVFATSPAMLYRISPRLARQQFSIFDPIHTRTGPHSCRLDYRFERGYTPFPEMIEVIRGLMTAVPTNIGAPPAESVKASLTPQGFVLDISWKSSPSLPRRFYNVTLGRMKNYRKAIQELDRSHTLLEQKLDEAKNLSWRLEALVKIGQTVERGLEPYTLLHRFSRALEHWLHVRLLYVRLVGGLEWGDSSWSLAIPDHFPPAQAPFYPLAQSLPSPLEGEARAFLLEDANSSNGVLLLHCATAPFESLDQELLLDALDRLSHALQNVQQHKELEEYRRSLERKVDERTAELSAHAEHLGQSNKKLQEIAQAKQRFFTYLAHELKNPVTLLHSSLESLEQRLQNATDPEALAPSSPLWEMVHISRQNTDRIRVAVDDLLDLALLEESKLQPQPVRLSLQKVARQLLHEISPWSSSQQIDIRLEAPSSLPAVQGDARLLNKLLLNLLGNAIKYSPPQSTIVLCLQPHKDSLQVQILDRGPGIPPEARQRIFHPFEKNQKHPIPSTERGIGVGLSISREIARLHGSVLDVKPRPGGGSIFFFDLPLASNDPLDETTPLASPQEDPLLSSDSLPPTQKETPSTETASFPPRPTPQKERTSSLHRPLETEAPPPAPPLAAKKEAHASPHPTLASLVPSREIRSKQRLEESPHPSLASLVQAQLSSLRPHPPSHNLHHLPQLSTSSTEESSSPRTLRWPNEQKKRILLVDDEPDLLHALQLGLEDVFDLCLATSAREALQLLSQYQPEAIVSDVMMPEINGLEFCRILRQDEKTRQIPLLLLTAFGDLRDKLKGFEYGADDYITKPFQQAELIARIQTQIRLRDLMTENVSASNTAIIGTMAAGIAHEMKNPLNILLNSLLPLKEEIEPLLSSSNQLPLLLELIDESSQRLLEATHSFSRLSFHSQGPLPLHLSQLLQDLLDTRKVRMQGQITTELSCDISGTVLLPPSHVTLILGNLLDNAIDAILESKTPGTLQLRAHLSPEWLRIQIVDSGVGMTPDQLQNCLSPFFSTKPPEGGSGLGLSIVRQLLQHLGGKIELTSMPGKGTTATVWFSLLERHKSPSRQPRLGVLYGQEPVH